MNSNYEQFKKNVETRKFAIDNSWKADVRKPRSSGAMGEDDYLKKAVLLQGNISEAEQLKLIDGYLPITSHRKLGFIVIFIKKVLRKLLKIFFGWYIFPIYQRESDFNERIVNAVSLERDLLLDFKIRVNFLEEENEELREKLNIMTGQINSMTGQINSMTGQINSMTGQINSMTGQINSMNRAFDNTSCQMAKLLVNNSGIEKVPENLQTKATESSENEDDTYALLDYFDFQNHFRGTRAEIKDRLSAYVPYFQGQASNVLDIGCGRGEFLSLMKDNNINAFGIDLYAEYAAEGKLNGLDVRQGDGLAFLEQTEETFGGIFLGQVIEHISFQQLVKLCFNAYQKLEKGSCLVMETPNPRCLTIYSNWFFADPSHNKPVHPFTLEYILKKAGFSEVQTVYREYEFTEKLPLIDGTGIENIEQVNQSIKLIENLLYTAPDYAVVARK